VTAQQGAEQAAFIAALRDTGRGARERWLLVQGVDRDDAALVQSLSEKWQRLPLLTHPSLRSLALRALAAARGGAVDASTPFPSMLWVGGASDTYGGKRFKGTVGDFVERILRARAEVVAEKRCGWVVTPTSNTDGHRVNVSTPAVHALNFDCDGRGEWGALLVALETLGLAYIAYQSGGWSSAAPKWHVLLPLAAPSDTSSPERIEAHKRAYNAARVILGALAELPGEGFDPTVETPCVPVFITERRRAEDPPRRVVWRAGAALDLTALLAALPEVPRDLEPPRERRERDESEALDDARLEQIVAAICSSMEKILSGRRDLYLGLAGALIDRGLAADDVRAVIEEVSKRCPGDPRYTRREVEERHRQHLHDCETTINKAEAGGDYTRIGTIVDRWPDVARAIDSVLPNPEWAESVAWLESLRAPLPAPARPSWSPSSTIPLRPQLAVPVVARVVPVELGDLRAEVRRIRDLKLRGEDFRQRVRGFILKAVLVGDDPVPRIDGKPVDDDHGEPYNRERALEVAVWAIVSNADPRVLSQDSMVELMRFSAKRTLADGEVFSSVQSVIESAFKLATDLRCKNERRRAAEESERRKKLQQRYWRSR
jgi:hypothetical protein